MRVPERGCHGGARSAGYPRSVPRRLTAAVLLALVAGLLAACGSDDGSGPGDTTTTEAAAPVTGSLAGREWVLDADESSIDLPDGASATLRVEGGTVSGIGPCNSYRGSIQVDGSSVTIGSLAETMMACERPLMDAQSDFTAALRAVDTAEVDGDTLVLRGADDTALTFTAIDPAEQVLGDWAVTEVAKPDAIVGVRDGTSPTLTFAADGSMAVDTSCNTGNGPYELDGESIAIGPVAITERACTDPQGVMRQEARILAALDQAETLEVTPDRLTLLDSQGFIVLGASRAG